jgi:hypothetical protein
LSRAVAFPEDRETLVVVTRGLIEMEKQRAVAEEQRKDDQQLGAFIREEISYG